MCRSLRINRNTPSHLFTLCHRQQEQPQQPLSHPPTTQSIMMQIYITFLILLSFVHHIKMGGHAKAPATNRLRIFSRGLSLQSLPRQPAHTRNTRPRRIDSFKESHYPLTRLRFASSSSKSRVSVSHIHLRARRDRLFCARAHQRCRKQYPSILFSCSLTDISPGHLQLRARLVAHHQYLGRLDAPGASLALSLTARCNQRPSFDPLKAPPLRGRAQKY